MDLRKRYLTENECYKDGEQIDVKGLMLHSTGANNPKLGRYVDAPELEPEVSDYHWNTFRPGGRQVCVHGFIGLTPEDKVATYQTLPWTMRGWHAGGKANDTHIGVEICEGDLNDAVYFNKVYREAVELFAYLAKEFKLDPMKDIITHTEGNKKGIASNHADVMHWFPKHGKDMDDFRRDVRAEMEGTITYEQPIVTPDTPPVAPAPAASTKSIDVLAQEVIDGKHGSGDARKKSLGSQYDAVQARVNELMGGKAAPIGKSITTLAQEVIDGKHGSGDARKKSLGASYDVVQAKVNELMGAKSAPKPAAKSVDTLAQEVIDGKHGSGDARRKSLGNRYDAVQARVNQLLGARSSRPAAKSINQLVEEVLRGEHGSGRERMISLGSNYAAVQKEVNRRMR